MGNIRTTQIKNISEKLLKLYQEKFSDDFEHNKKVLDEILKIKSKTLRNKISGYITALIKKQNSSKLMHNKKK
ncbi:MAG: 30S ribosomal protein S17e [Candidatus Aenigmarchaeota archaeon]|nr:30S ribosomal protein S17e [Candidatus Aenigmarchaeota archaeon]MCX8179607.1 30S ribosomal protein S17e [Candidatus Aenigmarchaeota archaeon]